MRIHGATVLWRAAMLATATIITTTESGAGQAGAPRGGAAGSSSVVSPALGVALSPPAGTLVPPPGPMTPDGRPRRCARPQPAVPARGIGIRGGLGGCRSNGDLAISSPLTAPAVERRRLHNPRW